MPASHSSVWYLEECRTLPVWCGEIVLDGVSLQPVLHQDRPAGQPHQGPGEDHGVHCTEVLPEPQEVGGLRPQVQLGLQQGLELGHGGLQVEPGEARTEPGEAGGQEPD